MVKKVKMKQLRARSPASSTFSSYRLGKNGFISADEKSDEDNWEAFHQDVESMDLVRELKDRIKILELKEQIRTKEYKIQFKRIHQRIQNVETLCESLMNKIGDQFQPNSYYDYGYEEPQDNYEQLRQSPQLLPPTYDHQINEKINPQSDQALDEMPKKKHKRKRRDETKDELLKPQKLLVKCPESRMAEMTFPEEPEAAVDVSIKKKKFSKPFDPFEEAEGDYEQMDYSTKKKKKKSKKKRLKNTGEDDIEDNIYSQESAPSFNAYENDPIVVPSHSKKSKKVSDSSLSPRYNYEDIYSGNSDLESEDTVTDKRTHSTHVSRPTCCPSPLVKLSQQLESCKHKTKTQSQMMENVRKKKRREPSNYSHKAGNLNSVSSSSNRKPKTAGIPSEKSKVVQEQSLASARRVKSTDGPVTDSLSDEEGASEKCTLEDRNNVNQRSNHVPLTFKPCELYECNEKGCFDIFLSKVELDTHMKEHHIKSTTANKQKVTSHESLNRIRKRRKDSNGQSKEAHMLQNEFKCGRCTSSFAREKSLKLHIAEVHDLEVKFSCTQCESRFTHEYKLKNHMRMVHVEGKQVFRCSHCTKEFSNQRNLSEHIEKCHKSEIRNTSESEQIVRNDNQQTESCEFLANFLELP